MNLDIQNLCVSYSHCTILHDITTLCQSQQWTCVIGPNGAGKTTFLRAVLQFISYHGTITLEGKDMNALSPHKLSQLIAYLPQDPIFPSGISVQDFVLLGCTPFTRTPPSRNIKKIFSLPSVKSCINSLFSLPSANDQESYIACEKALKEVDLFQKKDCELSMLSGGEKRRACIAQLFAQNTPILILDEPTTHLDMGHAAEVMQLVASLQKQKRMTIISSMHDLNLVSLYADKVIALQEGSLIKQGNTDKVLTETTLQQLFGSSLKTVDLYSSRHKAEKNHLRVIYTSHKI